MVNTTNRSCYFILTFFLLSFFGAINSIAQVNSDHFMNGMRSGVVRVKFYEGQQPENFSNARTTGDEISIGIPAFDQISVGFGATQIRRIFEPKGGNEAKLKKHGLHLWYEVIGDPSQDISEILETYQNLGAVEIAEPNYEKHYEQGKMINVDINAARMMNDGDFPMNDPSLPDQWHYHNDGEFHKDAKAGADINLFDAWARHGVYGDARVIVSVHDEGVDIKHEDLVDNLWVNPGESADGSNAGKDTDGNGYVDDIHGFNFGDDTNEITPDPHGTHVAGTVAATNNNGIGVSGVAGGSGNGDGARVMVCQILTAGATAERIAESYIYAADNGAVISQNSWGYTSPDFEEKVIHDAIKYFIAEAGDYEGSPMKGGVVLFAPGNSNVNLKFYPGAYDEVIAVGAIAPDYTKASYSNFGEFFDVFAPGGDGFGPTEVLSLAPYNGYGYMAGTSMACPHVSGIAALVVSHPEYFGKITAAELENVLLTSVRDIYQYNSSAYEGQLGSGYIDTELALRIDDGQGPENITDFQVLGSSFDRVAYNWTVPSDVVDMTPEYYLFTWATSSDFADKMEIQIKNRGSNAGNTFGFELTKLSHLPFGTKIYAKLQAFDRWGNSNAETAVQVADILKTPVLAVEFDQVDGDGKHLIEADYKNQHTPWIKIKNDTEPGEGGMLIWSLSSSLEDFGRGAIEASEAPEVASAFDAGPALATISSADGGVNPHLATKMLEREDLYAVRAYEANSNVDGMNFVGGIDGSDNTIPNLHGLSTSSSAIFTIIGDGSRYVTNSLAQRFTVPDMDGEDYIVDKIAFRTHSRPDFYGSETVEILVGASLESAKRVMAFKVDKFEGNDVLAELNQSITLTRYADLPNKLVFQEGEIFWVVVHYPAGKYNITPMYIGTWAGSHMDKTSMMSFDGGNSWEDLNESLMTHMPQWHGSVFDLAVLPYKQSTQKIINPRVSSGMLAAGEEQMIQLDLKLDSVLSSSSVNHQLVHSFLTNENDETFHNLGVNFTLENVDPVFSFRELLDFGRVFNGGSKRENLYITNVGYTDASINWTIEGEDAEAFKLEGLTSLKARYQDRLKVSFFPTEAKEYYATAIGRVEGKDIQIRVIISGSGIAPSKMVLKPASIVLDPQDLNNETIVGNSFIIKNEGEAPLEYIIANYTDKEIPDYQRSNLFGYTYTTDFQYSFHEEEKAENPPVFRDISGDPSTQDVTDEIRISTNLNHRIDIGFAFPFFGDYYGHIYLSKYGILSFSDHIFNATPSFLDIYMPEGYISGMFHNLSFNDGGKLLFLKEQGKLTVQYHEVRSALSGIYNKPFSFQYVIYSNGDIDIVYDESFPAAGDQDGYQLRREVYVAIEEPKQKDGMLFKAWNSFPATGYAYLDTDDKEVMQKTALGYYVQFQNPGVSLAKNFNKTSGTLIKNEEHVITFDVDPSDWFEGEFEQNIAIVSNDPNNTSQGVHLSMDIVSGGVPSVESAVKELHFDAVLNQNLNSKYIPISNTGTSAFTINRIELLGDGFSIVNESLVGSRIVPKETAYIEVSAHTDEVATFEAVVNVELSGIEPLLFDLTSEVIHTPVFSWNWDEEATNLVMNRGEVANVPFTVKNDGNSDLKFFFNTDSWLNVYQLGAEDEVAEVDYHFEIGKEECWWEQSDGFELIEVCGRRGPVFDWVDLSTHPNADYMPDLNFWTDKPFKNKQLPFAFEFYGKQYNEVNIASFGFVTFNEVENKQWSEPGIIPYIPHGQSRWKTVIAPLYHPTAPNFYEYPDDAGVYYLAEEDKVTIQYHRYSDMFGMGYSMNFQLILYATGKFKFQYQMPESEWEEENTPYFLDTFGSIGIQSEDKQQGYQLSFMEGFLTDEMAIVFKPQQKFVLQPGQQGDYKLMVDSHEISGWEVEGDVHAITNVPETEESFKYPVSVQLNGFGEVAMEHEYIDLGILFYESFNEKQKEGFTQRVRMTNTGTLPIEVLGAGFEKSSPRQVLGERIHDGGSIYNFVPFEGYDFEIPKVIEPGDFFDFVVEIKPEYIADPSNPSQGILANDDFVDLNTNLKFSWKDGGNSQDPTVHIINMPWKAALGSAPIYGGHDEIIRDEIMRGDRKTFNIALSNEEGKSPLAYKAAVEYYRQYEPFARYFQPEIIEAEALPYAPLSTSMNAFNEAGDMEGDIPAKGDYEHFFANLLSNDAHSVLGFGEGVPFSVATKYQAPEAGTKLSRVWTMCRIEKTEIVDIKVSIYRGGSSPDDTHLIHEQIAVKTWEGEEEDAHWFAIDLEEELEILPYEHFYIQITYPRSIALPQAYNGVNKREYGRDYIISQGFWVDNNFAGMGGASWQIKAASKEEGTEAWLTFPRGNEGEIGIEENGSINFRVDASKDVDDYLSAEITFRTNDPVWKRPYHTEVMIDVVDPLNAEEEVKLGLYPNPAADFVTVSFTSEFSGEGTIEIYSTTGQKMQVATELLHVGLNQIQLPVSALPAGLYIIRVSTDQAVIGQANMIKQ
ncbi:S8 family serine peptidase [Persicobacter diffluens]|uniref:Peptidase S8/S53 domain-containing protein n=1 Tax=Persicobacter diffluens TaxID=981 RepID=A0AAN4VZL4_9BACT|nr:hypothetical protein PEDI_35660 [Persicobacter diffluens]